MDHIGDPFSSARSGIAANECRREATYCLSATARIRTEMVIQSEAQKRAGTPVAFAMFKASVGTVGANGDERKKTVLQSSKAFKTHCTASRLTTNVAARAEAKRATRKRPTVSKTPASKVNGMPLKATQAPAKIGFITPKIIVSVRTIAADASNTMRAATARRIKISNSDP